MSTRSHICRQNTDGSYDVIYCHYDGYPSHNGRILYAHYHTPEQVAALLALGDLSKLGPHIGHKHAFEERAQHATSCTAYARDLCEKGTEAQHLAEYDALAAMLQQSWAEWVYIYRLAERRWYYTNNPSPTWWKCCGPQRQTELLSPRAWGEDAAGSDRPPI
jgi:hypothetical protein